MRVSQFWSVSIPPIFIIKKENEEDFKAAIGDRMSKVIDVEYVFQDLNNIPETRFRIGEIVTTNTRIQPFHPVKNQTVNRVAGSKRQAA